MKVREKGKLLKWLKKRKSIIIIIAVVWTVIIGVNFLLSRMNNTQIDFPKTSYEPSYPIISDKYTVPESEKDNVEKAIDMFITNCNKKDYEQAYNFISDTCKKSVFSENIENFKNYIDDTFDQEKIYCIQNLSNDKNTYVYDIKLLDNYLTNGLKATSQIYYKNQEISLEKVNGEYKISLKSFIGSKEVNTKHEDEFIDIKIDKVENFYKTEDYTITVTNNSEYIAVLMDQLEENEILLDIGSDQREVYKDVFNFLAEDVKIVVNPKESKTYTISFVKFFDEYAKSERLIFNKVRLFREYTGNEETYKVDKANNSVREYGIEIDLTN